MGSFTSNFFNDKNKSSSTASYTKKKKNNIDVNNFTESFFSNYDDEDLKVSNKNNKTSYQYEYLKTQEQVDEYNDFISKLNADREEYYKKQQEIEIKKQQEEAKKQQEEFNKNKESMKQERTNYLIYNWNYDSSNKSTYDYKGMVDTNTLSKSDKLGIVTINKSQYFDLVNNELAGYKKQAEEYYKKQQERQELFEPHKSNNDAYINKHFKEGWIIKNGEYYKPYGNKKSYVKVRDEKENIITIDNKSYIKVLDEKPKSLLDEKTKYEKPKNYSDEKVKYDNPYGNKKSIYESQFNKLNKAIIDGDYTTANNALQVINEKYFGHSYNDSIIANGIFNYGAADTEWFQNKFNSNVERLNVINDTLNNDTTSEEVKVTLTKEKNKLELENQLIQYNRLFYINSLNKKVSDTEAFIKPIYDTWEKVGTMWGETFDEFDNGYQFGDVFKTGVNIFNNSIQSLGSTGKMVNNSFGGIESLIFSDLDDSEFKDVWLPAMTDVSTYLIPYVGQARFYINYAEPSSVISSAITREGSATIDTPDGSIKTANGWNALGATINIAANWFSDYLFGRIRGTATGKVGNKTMLEFERKWYKNSGRRILTNMGFSATGEASEEFIQTYAEAMQNMNENMSWSFFKEHYAEAIKAATIAFATAAGASAISSTFNTIKYGDQASYYNAQGNYIGPGAEEGMTSFKQYAKKYGVYDYSGNLIGVQNIRINEEVTDESGKIAYSVSDTKEQDKYNYSSLDNSNVKVDVKEDAITNIETQLEEGKIVTLINTSIVDNDIDVIKSTSEITVGDANIADNIKTVLVPSDEMATYIKSLNPNQKVYVFDPKSDSFYDDIVDYINNSADSNIIFKNANDFIPSDYTFSPIEVKEINNVVDEYRNKGKLLETLHTNKPLATITASDITSGNINDIMNAAKSKFLGDVLEGKYSKEIAQQEFKIFSEKLEQYATKTKENRTYIKDSRNNIVTFFKTGDNTYEAVDTVTDSQLKTNVLANVKTNGNIINGNLNSKLGLMKKQINAVNKLHDAMQLKGNYLTENSTGKEVASLVNQNKNMSKEILQALGVDGIIQGKNKVILTTAYSGMDNANMPKAIDKSVNYVEKQITSGEMKKKAETTAPKQVEEKAKPSEISTTTNQDIDKALNSKYKSITTGDDINDNLTLSEQIDKVFEQMKISDKSNKINYDELKTKVKKWFFDRYTHINEIAKPNNDTIVREAITQLEEVASDAQVMIHNVQLDSSRDINNAKKSLDQIFKPLKTKKQQEDYDKYHRLQLHIERLNAGVEGVVDLSKADAQKLVDKILKAHPEYNAIDNDLRIYNNTLLDLLENNGVISNQLNEKLRNRYKYYMPIYSSELSTFKDLGNDKYLKNMKVDNTINDVTKASKNVKSLRKSMEDKTYNVLSAIAKNNLATKMSESGNYTGDSSADLIYYRDGKITKMKTTTGIVDDITNNSLLHIADEITNIPVLKQFKQLSNLSYKFVLDPIYQVKNLVYDLADSSMIYSKDKAGFIKYYPLAVHAISANSEIFNEARMLGLMDYGKINIEYDANGNTIEVKENKYTRLYNNLENIPKLAEYMSLKEKYMKQARKDYEAGKYNKNNFNNSVAKSNDGKLIPLYHGTNSFGFEDFSADFNDKTRSYGKENILVSFFSDNRKNAETYTKDINNVYEVYLNIQKPLVVDCDSKSWSNLDPKSNPFGKTKTDDIIVEAIKSGKYDGVIFNNIIDRGPNYHGKLESVVANDYVVFDNSQIIQTKNYNKDNISFADIEEEIKMRAKLDAQDVNLHFDSGGTVSKALSKAGVRFFNAGTLGLDKFITHVGNNIKTPKGAGSLMLEFIAVGVGTALANRLINGDDEDYDKLPYYYKNNYFMIKLDDGQYLRVPKGRVQSLYNVLFEYASGIRTEDDAKTYAESIYSAFDQAVLPPDLGNANPFAGFIQVLNNEVAFGNEIYSNTYDSNTKKVIKSGEHILSSYFGRYGRIVNDIIDGATGEGSYSDILGEFDFYKDTTKANRHLSTVYNIRNEYQYKKELKTTNDKAEKKYIDTGISALNSISAEINDGKERGLSAQDMKELYAARDDLINQIIHNYKNYEVVKDDDGTIWYYFDDHCFKYHKVNHKDGSSDYQFKKMW